MKLENPKSAPRIRIEVVDGVLWLEVDDVPGEPRNVDAVTLAMQAARDKGCRSILFDIRKLNQPGYHASVIQSAEMAAAAGIVQFRVAVLGMPGSELLAFIDDVAVNRGLPARSFTDEALAMRWLKSGA